jgi:hypothetical protein
MRLFSPYSSKLARSFSAVNKKNPKITGHYPKRPRYCKALSLNRLRARRGNRAAGPGGSRTEFRLGWRRIHQSRHLARDGSDHGRGTAQQWIEEGKNAVKSTRLSCHDFVDNQVRLQLFAPAYNLGNFLRRLALPKAVKHWSMTTLREKLVKIGAGVITHARYVILQVAEVAVPRRLFAGILERIQRLRRPTVGVVPSG